jgi:hypothetical protein
MAEVEFDLREYGYGTHGFGREWPISDHRRTVAGIPPSDFAALAVSGGKA